MFIFLIVLIIVSCLIVGYFINITLVRILRRFQKASFNGGDVQVCMVASFMFPLIVIMILPYIITKTVSGGKFFDNLAAWHNRGR